MLQWSSEAMTRSVGGRAWVYIGLLFHPPSLRLRQTHPPKAVRLCMVLTRPHTFTALKLALCAVGAKGLVVLLAETSGMPARHSSFCMRRRRASRRQRRTSSESSITDRFERQTRRK